jgi:single-stranded-DNA-specific exonuclease
VPLLDENRILVRSGLDILNQRKQLNLGLYTLLRLKSLENKLLDVFDIGFVVGPCVNACGRLGHAADAVRLFTTEDAAEAETLATQLVGLNEQRKAMTTEAVERVMAQLQGGPLDKVLVIYDAEVHESIAGIVAGRIKDKLHRPVIMLTKGEQMAKGSARSIEQYNIFEALYKNRELFIRFGGHSMAAGMSLPVERIDTLRERLNAECQLTEADFVPILRLDKQLQPEAATYELAKELKLLEPYGRDNPEPLFGAKHLQPEKIRMIDEKNTMIFTFGVGDTYRKIRGICFGLNDQWKSMLAGLYEPYDCEKICGGVLRGANLVMDVVYALEINDYNNNVTVQMKIKDFRLQRAA